MSMSYKQQEKKRAIKGELEEYNQLIKSIMRREMNISKWLETTTGKPQSRVSFPARIDSMAKAGVPL